MSLSFAGIFVLLRSESVLYSECAFLYFVQANCPVS